MANHAGFIKRISSNAPPELIEKLSTALNDMIASFANRNTHPERENTHKFPLSNIGDFNEHRRDYLHHMKDVASMIVKYEEQTPPQSLEQLNKRIEYTIEAEYYQLAILAALNNQDEEKAAKLRKEAMSSRSARNSEQSLAR